MSASLTVARIAVLIPCLNEEVTISKVVQDFRKELPGATIYVFDNNSKARTRDPVIGTQRKPFRNATVNQPARTGHLLKEPPRKPRDR